ARRHHSHTGVPDGPRPFFPAPWRARSALGVLVWQVQGTKTFHGYLDPDKHLSANAAVLGETTGEEPPGHDEVDRHSVTMRPGGQLWSHALTPQWDTTESALAMSVTLARGGLCHQGRFSERELALRAYWDENPTEAWMHDLRNVRY
ncbi:hypothetical protein ABZW30_43950, partial [Kitasatospora sp. NPDC004669]